MLVLEKLLEIQELATLPTVTTKILQQIEDNNVDIRNVAHTIETDASLTAKVLKVANSAIYGLRTPVASISQAIITIGLNRLANIVIGVSIFSRFMLHSQHHTRQLMEKFWWHSASVGIVSKTLSNKIGKNYKEFEFIGGLLHDFGKLILLQYKLADYVKVLEIVTNEGVLDTEAEKRIFGVDHLEVGSFVAQKWKLPLPIVNVIGYHSKLTRLKEDIELSAIIRFSDLLCEMWGADFFEGYQIINFEEQPSWKILKERFPELNELDLEKFTFELEEDFKKSSEFLKIISSI
ncbi:MAG: HDOD domain-containing protein [Ignavibacteria bacterium]|nr:HDOD domain-containing protein [Ignavibacteria bacterium]